MDGYLLFLGLYEPTSPCLRGRSIPCATSSLHASLLLLPSRGPQAHLSVLDGTGTGFLPVTLSSFHCAIDDIEDSFVIGTLLDELSEGRICSGQPGECIKDDVRLLAWL